MALVNPYCTVADVQKETQNSGSELTTWYETCVIAASRFIEDYCDRDFWFHDHSEGEDPYEVDRDAVLGDEIFLPFPIITLTKIWVFSDRTVGATSNDLMSSDEYYWLDRKGHSSRIVSEVGPFGAHPFRANVHLEGTFGYVITDTGTPPAALPNPIRRACTLIAAAISVEKRIEQVALDGSTASLLDTSIPKEAKVLLGRYRLRRAEV